MATDLENPFWDFSLVVYARPGVAEACLALQDRHGLDVNLLLFCCWAGAQGQRLETGDLARALASAGDWQRSVVAPLRGVRRRLKECPEAEEGPLEALRRAVKDCELNAERIEQALLHDAFLPGPEATTLEAKQAAAAAANLSVYLELAGPAIGRDDEADLAAILCGAFDGLAPEAAQKLLGFDS